MTYMIVIGELHLSRMFAVENCLISCQAVYYVYLRKLNLLTNL